MVISFKIEAYALVLLLFSGNVFAGGQAGVAGELTEAEMIAVASGKIIKHTTSEDYTKEIQAYLMVKAPASTLFNIITDYPQLPEFMPYLASTEVLQQDELGAVVNYTLSLPFGVSKKYRLKLVYTSSGESLRVAWESLPWAGLKPSETVEHTKGYWWLVSQPQTNSTLITYYTKTNPGHVPFGLGWVVDYMTQQTVIDVLTNTRTRAEKAWQLR